MAQIPLTATQPTTVHHIQRVYSSGPNESHEEGCQLAWEHICSAYFPKATVLANGTSYSVNRESHRGQVNNISQYIVDIVVESVTPTIYMGSLLRDVIWVECKAITHDLPYGWKNLLMETTTRLQSAHPNRFIHVVVAVGWKAMLFYWNPINPGQGLRITSADGHTIWHLDRRLVPRPQSPWINGRDIDKANALRLCFGPNPANPQLSLPDLGTIEGFMMQARAAPLPGLNPGHWN